jgi:anti-sigma factor RsiW
MLDAGAPHHEDLAGYVLGALEPDELAAFEEHLAGCELCRAEVAELQGVPRLLRLAAPALPVLAGLRERTLRGPRAGAGWVDRRPPPLS